MQSCQSAGDDSLASQCQSTDLGQSTGIESKNSALDQNTCEGLPHGSSYKTYRAIEARMAELQAHHIISQRYFFPFPYLCQIYHLLNLKHLESVHGFSLNNLEILKVSHFHSTEVGGMIRFQTVLRSPFNILRLWRQPIVEVDLILHDPFTIELIVPIYQGKQITVLFNVIPLHDRGHELFIDIYTNLNFPKPLLKPFLHLASCLTVLEDLP